MEITEFFYVYSYKIIKNFNPYWDRNSIVTFKTFLAKIFSVNKAKKVFMHLLMAQVYNLYEQIGLLCNMDITCGGGGAVPPSSSRLSSSTLSTNSPGFTHSDQFRRFSGRFCREISFFCWIFWQWFGGYLASKFFWWIWADCDFNFHD